MFDLIKRSMCNKCMFSDLNCIKIKCKHYYIYQEIIDRKGSLHAVEILSRPIISTGVNSIEEYFDNLDTEEGKKLIRHQLMNILQTIDNLNVGTNKVFLNVDRYLLLDDNIVDILTSSSKKLNQHNWDIVFEITERQFNKMPNIKQTFYKMIVDDISFAADDYSSIKKTHHFIHDYTYVKIDMDDIKRGINNDYNNFIDELYLLNESGVKLVAEKVQSKNDFLLTYSLPFDYFQGFHFDS
ncbi:MAG: EAL domain-containing protein [Shewanella sp.]